MIGNENQYNPSEMFAEWIRRGGQAQAEFAKSFGSLMTTPAGGRGAFNPLETLRRTSELAQRAQSEMLQSVSSMQSRGLDAVMLGMGQTHGIIPSIAGWGAYKTSVGSNGRISIPEAERNALGIGEGDLVQVIILPIPNRKKREVNEQS